MKTSCALALVSAVILALGAIPANASGADRTWVSGTTGADTGTCPISAPCASFSYALSQTATGGEIDCLTPGDFGIVTINKSVSIICDGVSNGGILTGTATTAAITINAGSGATVYLSGLDLNGLNATATDGVLVTTASTVYINHSTIQNFVGGVFVNSSTNPTRVIIKDSTIVKNSIVGVAVGPTASATNAAIIVNSLIDANGSDGVSGNNASGTAAIALEGTTVTGSPTGVNLADGATAEFIGPSNTIGGAINGTTTSVSFK
jgi:hypothetical protein